MIAPFGTFRNRDCVNGHDHDHDGFPFLNLSVTRTDFFKLL